MLERTQSVQTKSLLIGDEIACALFPYGFLDQGQSALELNLEHFARWLDSPKQVQSEGFSLDDSPFGTLDYWNLGILIPPRLIEVIHNQDIGVVRLNEWIEPGMDQGYKPSLLAMIIQQNCLESTKVQEVENSPIYKPINYWRKKAISRGLMTDSDRVLLLLIAHNQFVAETTGARGPLGFSNHKIYKGLDIIHLSIAHGLQGQGIGYAFYDRFEEIAQAFGYKYLYGINDRTNIGFFLQRGRYTLDQLRESQLLIPFSRNREWGIATVKFLDRELEKELVKPEFLK